MMASLSPIDAPSADAQASAPGPRRLSLRKRLSAFFLGASPSSSSSSSSYTLASSLAAGAAATQQWQQQSPRRSSDSGSPRSTSDGASPHLHMIDEHAVPAPTTSSTADNNNGLAQMPDVIPAAAHTPRPRPPSAPAPSDIDPFYPTATMAGEHRASGAGTTALSVTARRRYKLDDFVIGACIGRGFFSEVHIVTHKRTQMRFALKKIKEVKDTTAKVAFMKEVETLISLRHPNVLQFCAVFVSDQALHLLTEFMEGGTLRKLLKAKDTIPLPYNERWKLALELAQGMEYLHSNNIMHRDLKSKNCLLTADHSLVIADLGLAHMIHVGEKLNESAGTPYWMAPEILHGEPYDKAADVFSFGVVLCEILTRLKATPDEIPRLNSFALDEAAFRPLCIGCPEKLVLLALDCCQLDPATRPTFTDIVKRLRNMSQFDLAELTRDQGNEADDSVDDDDGNQT